MSALAGARREISQAIERHTDPRLDKVTASAETVRRMITGKVLPGQERLYAVFRVLRDLAEVDPDAERWKDDGGYSHPDPESNWQYLRRLWDTALEDESDAPPLPRPTPPPPEPKPAPAKGNSWAAAASDDPWNRDGGHSDEPPF